MLVFYVLCVFFCLTILYVVGEGNMNIAEASAAICVSFVPVLNFGVVLALMIVAFEQWEHDREMAKRNCLKEQPVTHADHV